MTRLRRSPSLPLVIVLIAELLDVQPVHADPPVMDGNAPLAPAFAESTRAAAPPASAPVKTDSEQVAPDGSFVHSVPLKLPPGRNGMAPGLALSYSSSSQEASAFGAGWSLPLSVVRRNTRYGTPRITSLGGTRHYDDAESGTPRFERDGTELVTDLTSPADTRGAVYRDRVDHTFAKSLYHAASPSYWLIIDKSGTQQYYGNVPDGSVPEAVLRDELGITNWGLVRTVDPFGNAVDYQYVQAPRSALADPQLSLLPAKIQYGANTSTHAGHYAEVDFTYQTTPSLLRLDHAAGHTYLDRIIQQIDIKVLQPAVQPSSTVRTYILTVTPSSSSAKYLLTDVVEQSGALQAPKQHFEYTTSPVARFASDANTSFAIDQRVMRLFDAVQSNNVTPFQAAVLAAQAGGWPKEYMQIMTPMGIVFSPPGIAPAFNFLDLDGDGAVDIVYHPTYAAGFGFPQPWMSFRQTAPGVWQTLVDAYPKHDPLGTAEGASAYVDVDGDGVVDRIKFAAPPMFPGLSQGTAPTPALVDICNWWFEHQGGYTDPVPIGDWVNTVIGAYLVDQAAAEKGIRTAEWNQAVQNVVNGAVARGLNQLPTLAIGAGGGFGFCYGAKGTATNPIQTTYVPTGDPQSVDWGSVDWGAAKTGGTSTVDGGGPPPGWSPAGGSFSSGPVYLERGRFLDPTAARSVWQGALQRYPSIGDPAYTLNSKVVTSPSATNLAMSIKGLTVTRSVSEPIIDLDHDGVPEIVTVKSSASGFQYYGAGVWRIHDFKPVHEVDDKNTTETTFAASLDAIYNMRKKSGLLVDPTTEQCQPTMSIPVPYSLVIKSPVDPAVVAATKPADVARPQVRATAAKLELPVETIQTALTRSEELLDPRNVLGAKLGDWMKGGTYLGQRLIPHVDWITTFNDVNGDGLPDLVMAKGATCIDPSSKGTNHQAGFDVFLNRGDRFDTSPAAGIAFADGPFNLLRNWTSSQLEDWALVDNNRFPFSAMSFSDIDGDGIQDAMLSAVITNYNNANPSWAWDANACIAGPGIANNPGQKYPIRCVWRGTGSGWSAAKDVAASLPFDAETYSASLVWKQMAHGPVFLDGLSSGDRLRWVDLDRDGVSDVISMRMGDGAVDATRVYHNASGKPDLLRVIDNGIGARSVIDYVPRPSDMAAHERVPTTTWVVQRITTDPQADKSDAATPEVSTFEYHGAKYDFARRQPLGFAQVIERRQVVAADGTNGGTLVSERDFFQDETSEDPKAKPPDHVPPNPLKGVLRAEERRSEPTGLTETIHTDHHVELVAPPADASHWRVRSLGETTTTIQGAATITANRVLASFDDYDNAKMETTTAVRATGDAQLDPLGAITITHARQYLNDTDHWILGLVADEVRSDVNGQLGHDAFTYEVGKIKTHTRTRKGIQKVCADAAPTFEETFAYTADGLLSDRWSDNNWMFSGNPPHRHVDFDVAWHALPALTTDDYWQADKPLQLSEGYTYDYRFGVAATRTNANGNTQILVRDALGRISDVYNEDSELVQHHDYNLATRPIMHTVTERPGNGQPDIKRTEYFDGESRLRQATALKSSGAAVEQWVSYDSLGEVSERALPWDASIAAFVPRSQASQARDHVYRDPLGRAVRLVLPDGRTTSTSYAVGAVTDLDAKATPRTERLDAFGRVMAVDECYMPSSGATACSFHRTWLYRDGDGHVLRSVDGDGNVRNFTYDDRGAITSAEAPHTSSGAVDTYTWCYDGEGRQTQSVTPEGRKITQYRDELGREIQRSHEPAQLYSQDDAVFLYDDPNVPNGRGRLTMTVSMLGSWSYAYDKHGHTTSRTWSSSLGTNAAPWKDGVFSATSRYDQLGRPLVATLPFDANQMEAQVTLSYGYDERGYARSLAVDGKPWLGIDDYSAAGQPRHMTFGNGLQETRHYEPLSDRLKDSTLSRGTATVQGYAFGYDNNNNPNQVTRTFGVSPSVAPTVTKTYAFDSLDRLEKATYAGLGNQTTVWTYAYSWAGNIVSKDGLTYRYDGRDPQAATSRVDSTGAARDGYQYDRDGQLVVATSYSGGTSWSYAWDGDGRLTTAHTTGQDLRFDYSPEGERVLKRLECTGSCTPWSDVYVGPLELRGAESNDPAALPAYYNLDLGPIHAQLALRMDAANKLARDPQADRFYYRDYLGSTAVVTGPDGASVNEAGAAGRLEYAPFGESLLAEPNAANIKHRFNGKEFDESGLAYYGARYANPQLGRWTSRDPVALGRPDLAIKSAQAANLYSFSDNNPAALVDPDGRQVVIGDPRTPGTWLGRAGAALTDMANAAPKEAALDANHALTFMMTSPFALLGDNNANGPGLHTTPIARPSDREEAERIGLTILTAVALGVLGNAAGKYIGKFLGGETGAVLSREAPVATGGGIRANAARGKAFEGQVAAEMEGDGWTVAREVTLETPGGARTRMDIVGTRGSSVRCVECKSSATAPLTPRQTEAHPQIEAQGATVMGRGKPSVPGGTQIPPTRVEIRRPEEP